MWEEEAKVFLHFIGLSDISGYIFTMSSAPTDRPDRVPASDHLVPGSWALVTLPLFSVLLPIDSSYFLLWLSCGMPLCTLSHNSCNQYTQLRSLYCKYLKYLLSP